MKGQDVMSLLETGLVAIRDRKRLAEIVAVIARFGIDDVLGRIGLSGLASSSRRDGGEAMQADAPERLRLAPMVQSEMLRRYAPGAVFGKGRALAFDLAGLALDLPALIRLLALRVRRGRISASVELQGLERIGGDIRWAATRIAVSIVTAAFALGLAPRLFEYGLPVFGVPLPLWLGLGVIAAGLVWLIMPRR